MVNKYWVTGGTGNWSSTTNWSLSSGGASGAPIPLATDPVIFDANSGTGTATVDTTTATCYSFTGTNFNGTLAITASQKLTVRQNFTLGAGMTLSGTPATSQLDLGYSSTAGAWNFAGLSLPWSVTKIGTGAITLLSNVVIQGKYGMTGNHNFTGVAYTMEVQGGWGINTNYYFNDSATNPTVKITGGTILGVFPNSTTGCILEPSVSDIILTPHTTNYQLALRESTYLIANSSTYDIITTGSSIYVIAFSGKIETGTNCIFNVMQYAGGTHTITADIYMNYYYINNGTININTTNDSKVYVSNYLNYRSTAGIAGNATIEFTGTGTMFLNESYLTGSYGNGAGGYADTDGLGRLTVSANIVINSTGTVTIYRGNLSTYGIISLSGGGSLTYTAGTIVFQRDLNPEISGSFTFNVPDWNLGIATFSTNTDILSINDDLTFDTINMYDGSKIKIANSKEFTVNDNVNGCANELYQNSIESISGTGKFSYLGSMANIQFAKTDFTNIDASDSSVRIYTWYGSATNCINVYAVTGANLGGGVSVYS